MAPSTRTVRGERALSAFTVAIGVALALVAPRVVPPQASDSRAHHGVVLIGPLGLRTLVTPSRR